MHTEHNPSELRQLTERFWAGETSLEEEARLHRLCAEGDVPPELEGMADYFAALGPDPALGEDFDETLMGRIPAGRVFSLRRFGPYFAAAAIAGALFFGWWSFSGEEAAVATTNDQKEYTQEEVQQAWEQTQQALKKVGTELNEAKQQTAVINKFNEAQLSITRK